MSGQKCSYNGCKNTKKYQPEFAYFRIPADRLMRGYSDESQQEQLELEAKRPDDKPENKESDEESTVLEYEEIENTINYNYTIKVEDPNEAQAVLEEDYSNSESSTHDQDLGQSSNNDVELQNEVDNTEISTTGPTCDVPPAQPKEHVDMLTLCRMCASPCWRGSILIHSEDSDLPALLLKYLNLWVKRSGLLPKKICLECHTKLQDWIKLTATVEKSQEYFQKELSRIKHNENTKTVNHFSDDSNSQNSYKIIRDNHDYRFECNLNEKLDNNEIKRSYLKNYSRKISNQNSIQNKKAKITSENCNLNNEIAIIDQSVIPSVGCNIVTDISNSNIPSATITSLSDPNPSQNIPDTILQRYPLIEPQSSLNIPPNSLNVNSNLPQIHVNAIPIQNLISKSIESTSQIPLIKNTRVPIQNSISQMPSIQNTTPIQNSIPQIPLIQNSRVPIQNSIPQMPLIQNTRVPTQKSIPQMPLIQNTRVLIQKSIPQMPLIQNTRVPIQKSIPQMPLIQNTRVPIQKSIPQMPPIQNTTLPIQNGIPRVILPLNSNDIPKLLKQGTIKQVHPSMVPKLSVPIQLNKHTPISRPEPPEPPLNLDLNNEIEIKHEIIETNEQDPLASEVSDSNIDDNITQNLPSYIFQNTTMLKDSTEFLSENQLSVFGHSVGKTCNANKMYYNV